MQPIIVSLPWPPKAASPNARAHWAAVHRARSRYRADARILAIAAGVREAWSAIPTDAALRVKLRICPPDKRRRDWDNIIASLKSGLDGIADAMGVDDSRFRLSIEMAEPVAGGRIDVEVVQECRD